MQATNVPGASPRQRILAVINQEKTAMSSGDVEFYFSVVASDAVYLPPNATAKKGAELREWLAEFLRHYSVEWVQWREGELVVSENFAYHDYAYKMKSTPKAGGPPVIGNGKGLELFRRDENGAWKIIRHMWNATPDAVV